MPNQTSEILKDNQLISIVTPCYNTADCISQTIKSVIDQSYKNWEMLIIDDCSTDGSYDIAMEYSRNDNRIKVHRMKQNSAAGMCRNKAIELSKGNYLAFIDSDDIWLPEKLEKQLRFMQENDCDFCFTEYEHIDERGMTLRIRAKAVKNLNYKKMLLHCWTGCSTVMYKQDVNNKILAPIPTIPNCEDYLLFFWVLKNVRKGMGYPECLTKYRVRANSFSRNKLKRVKPFFTTMAIMIGGGKIFAPCFYLLCNQVIKLFWKYKKIKYRNKT